MNSILIFQFKICHLEGRLILLFSPFFSDIIFTAKGMDCPDSLILSIENFSCSTNVLSGIDTRTKKEISDIEVQKTIEFQDSSFYAPHLGLLNSKLYEYLAWELYYANDKVGVKHQHLNSFSNI